MNERVMTAEQIASLENDTQPPAGHQHPRGKAAILLAPPTLEISVLVDGPERILRRW